MRWSVVVALVFTANLLAGCSGGSLPSSSVDGPVPGVQVQADGQTGAIRGVVVDDGVRPVAGAKVVANPGNHVTNTTGSGGFGFSNLKPGTYFLTASKPGFAGVQASVDVVAGVADPPVTRIQLRATADTKPFFEEMAYHGYLALGQAVYVAGNYASVSAGDPTGLIGEGSFKNTYQAVPGAPTRWVQSEFVWDAGSDLAKNLRVEYDHDGTGRDFIGPSHLLAFLQTKEINATAMVDKGVGFVVWAYPDDPTGTTTGLGLAAQQKFDAYTHLFHGYAPPTGWAFGKDGEALPPK